MLVAYEPHDGHASVNPVRVDPLLRRKPGSFRGPIDQRGEAFLRIVKYREVGEHALKLIREEHVKSVIVDYGAARPRVPASAKPNLRR